MKSHSFRLPLLALIAALPCAAHAQQQPVYSQADIRPADATADLNANLARLGANPRDISALIGAGEAALALNDPRAATGFFARADEIESGNGRIKAGLGRAMLELQNPTEALRLFDQATRLGQPDRAFLSDRGLARDLTGDTAGAQRDYQAALRNSPGDADVIRRYAISLGISGQVEAADKLVEPLLYKSDRAAWRNRAFVYAMNGRQKEARDITHKVMPQTLADQIQPYMDRMPGLTPAQRAAAVHFGTFPSQGLRMAAAPIVQAPPATVAQPTPTPAPSTVGRSSARSRPGRQLAQTEVRASVQPIPASPSSAPPSSPDPRSSVESASISRARPSSATSLLDTSGTAASQAVSGDDRAAQQLTTARRLGERVNMRIGDTPTQIAAKQAAAEAQRKAEADRLARTAAVQPQFARAPQLAMVAPARAPVVSAVVPGAVQGPPAPGQPIATTAPQPIVSPPREVATVQPTPTPKPSAAAPVSVAQPSPVVPQPAIAPTPVPNPEATRTLADIIRELQVPDAEKETRVAAVDLNEVAALQQQRRTARQAVIDKAKKVADAKAKAEADAKAKAEAAEKARLKKNPERAWVQVGTGRNIPALGFTMKGLRKKYDALGSKGAWSASWGQTNRLVVGPFASFAKARAFEAELKKSGADAFAWQSDAGEEVSAIGGK